ncbi:glycoside hydrolase family 65 protein [Dermatophilus congolensis]|uniref:glycoside hydrolase family 65 protein n=1 Tax=Dermatophilus congolensis TaxID=1863 RepID=UPI003C7EC9CE
MTSRGTDYCASHSGGHRMAGHDPLDRARFPVDPWRLVERRPDMSDLGTTETLFAIGNGYIGMRANPPEGREAFAHGTFVNGFHETWPIRHAEDAYGFATTGQTIVNAPDSKLMKLYIDDEPLLLSMDDVDEYERSIDFREGVLRRDLVWRTPSGKRVKVSTTAMTSFAQRHLAIFTLQVTLLDGDAPVAISSQIMNRQDGVDEYHVKSASMGGGFDPRRSRQFAHRVLEPKMHWHSDRRMLLGWSAANSGMTLAVGADHAIHTDNEYEMLISTEEDLGKMVYRVDAQMGKPIYVTKAVAYHTSRGVPVRELFDRCRRTLDRVRQTGIFHCVEEQATWLRDYWANSDVEITGDRSAQQAIRWNLFQLAQASARADQLGIPAKGLTGSGYEGHYFWDTDIYVVPFLSYTSPTAARNALRFRVLLLDKARERARMLASQGALFPWRTINGEEASAYYAAGTAQFHIDADVTYAIRRYLDTTGDEGFLTSGGIDVLVETARMWADLGFWRTDKNGSQSFNIHGVTGPDEYTTVVNNNLYTNVMARFNLEVAADAVEHLAATDPEQFALLTQRLNLEHSELTDWREAACAMTIPFDESLGIHPQDDNFLCAEQWDLSTVPADKRPLLLHFHPLVIYRFQVLKQADVVLALFLQGNRFSEEEKRRDFEYYDPITTGDSTLSAVVQSIVAAQVGHKKLAMEYFREGLFVDLADLHSNTSDGVHIASAGGVWNALAYGFAGLRDSEGNFEFDPRLPESWEDMTLRLRIRGSRLRVLVEREAITLTLEEGDPLTLKVRGVSYTVTSQEPVRVGLEGQGPQLPPICAHGVAGSKGPLS